MDVALEKCSQDLPGESRDYRVGEDPALEQAVGHRDFDLADIHLPEGDPALSELHRIAQLQPMRRRPIHIELYQSPPTCSNGPRVEALAEHHALELALGAEGQPVVA